MSNTIISKDLANRKLNITREFAAPVEKVWKAWTDSSILDKWWAPRPWKAETKTMNFTEGGMWLYCMAGPNGEQSWNKVDFKTIEPGHSFTAVSTFCDEQGNIVETFPTMHWHNVFQANGDKSKMAITITFDKEADLAKILEMGFEGGFTMGLNNLDEVLAQ
ncbi:MAG: hypothetical protein JWQ38_2445 [Flavipsychrobacter sp.]|nr:hypothetical protein [Flavipsychrobacter sp.]